MKLSKSIQELNLEELKKEFEEKGVLMLKDFFEEDGEFKTFIEKKKAEIGAQLYNPLSHSYSRLKQEKMEELTLFLKELFGKEVEIESQWKSYTHKDFVILNDKRSQSEKLLFILDFSKDWNSEAGGRLVFTTKEEEVLYLEPSFNTLTLIKKEKELLMYLKYINNKSKKNKLVRMEGILI
jgi:Rps23 Pro-64 3,4-dihydroxylase Tpa1-like proline 4-hydroxylase